MGKCIFIIDGFDNKKYAINVNPSIWLFTLLDSRSFSNYDIERKNNAQLLKSSHP
jgi:hypothetical protein